MAGSSETDARILGFGEPAALILINEARSSGLDQNQDRIVAKTSRRRPGTPRPGRAPRLEAGAT
jgi:hypothetical protein